MTSPVPDLLVGQLCNYFKHGEKAKKKRYKADVSPPKVQLSLFEQVSATMLQGGVDRVVFEGTNCARADCPFWTAGPNHLPA